MTCPSTKSDLAQITKLTGKWKVSQNQPASNQAGVVQGLESLGTSESTEMATLVENASQKTR